MSTWKYVQAGETPSAFTEMGMGLSENTLNEKKRNKKERMVRE